MKSANRRNQTTTALKLLFLLAAASAHTASAELVLSAFTGKIDGAKRFSLGGGGEVPGLAAEGIDDDPATSCPKSCRSPSSRM